MNYSNAFETSFRRVPLPRTKYLRLLPGTENINIQLVLSQFNLINSLKSIPCHLNTFKGILVIRLTYLNTNYVTNCNLKLISLTNTGSSPTISGRSATS